MFGKLFNNEFSPADESSLIFGLHDLLVLKSLLLPVLADFESCSCWNVGG